MDLVALVIGIFAFGVVVFHVCDKDKRNIRTLVGAAVTTLLCSVILLVCQMVTPTVTVKEWVTDYPMIKGATFIRFSQPVKVKEMITNAPWMISHYKREYFIVVDK